MSASTPGTIRARVCRGRLEPLETLDLIEGEEVEIVVSSLPIAAALRQKAALDALRTTDGGWRGLVDADEFKRNVYADRLISDRPVPHL